MIAEWRHRRAMSQLALASASGVSSRHISFVETGRAHPSREVLLRLAHAMDLTRSQENRLLIAAGYLPNFRCPPHDAGQWMALRRAFRIIVRNQRPYPAYVLDRAWNLVMSNKPFRTLLHHVADDVGALGKPLNAVRLFLHPGQLRPHVLNWEEVATILWNRVRADLQVPNPRPETLALIQEIKEYPGMQDVIEQDPLPEDRLLVPITFDSMDGPMSWFSIIGSLGFPPELSTYQLRIEVMFPADKETDAAMRRLMGSESSMDRTGG